MAKSVKTLTGMMIQRQLTPRQIEILEGLMLGDGHLSKRAQNHNPHLKVTRSASDIEYNAWLAEEFSEWITKRGIFEYSVHDRRTNKDYHHCAFRTICHEVFQGLFDRWYPDGIKRVPQDVKLTPLTMAIWFADDGSISNPDLYSLDLKLAVHGFLGSDAERLRSLLESVTQEDFRIYTDQGHPTIRGFTKSSQSFLRIIDPHFPPLVRKSDVWRRDDCRLLKGKPEKPDCPRCNSSKVYSYGRRNSIPLFKCMTCVRVFQEEYERRMRD